MIIEFEGQILFFQKLIQKIDFKRERDLNQGYFDMRPQ